jgi:predicted phage terminase large subunit-like protein
MKQLLTGCSPIRMGFAPYAEPMAALAGPSIGLPISYPTTIIRRENCAASYATIATELPDELEIPQFWNAPSSTSGLATDIVEDVTPWGIEHVYDLTVDETHCFLSNGVWCKNTRWHEDDLAGRCLNHQHWDVLSLPAFAKVDDQLGRAVDEPLWADDDYGYGEQLRALRETTPPRVWSALYMCSPAPDEGDYFKEDWLKPVDILPSLSTMRTYGASDYAVTGEGGDYTVHVVFGVDPLNNLYLLDLWRGQKASDIWVEALCDLVQKYRPLAWAEEGGQIKSGIGPFLDRRMRERRVYVNRISFPTRGDKSIRARSIQGRMALDGLYYPKRAPWAADWTAELLTFPASKHDDQCDAMGLCGQLLDIMVKGRAGLVASPRLPKDDYKSDRKIKTIDAMTL